MLVSPVLRIRMEDAHPELSKSQLAAVDDIFLNREKIVGLDGVAGAGKTTTLSVIRELHRNDRVLLVLWLSMLTTLYLVAETLQPHGEFGAVHTCRIVLRLKETTLLQRARLAILPLCDVEDHSMGMKLRRCVSINWTRSVMLEGCCYKLSSRLRRMNIADAGLRVVLQFMQCNANAFAMCFTHTLITANESCYRYRLWCGERRIPTCAMFRAGNLPAILVFIGSCRLVLNELRGAYWMLSFA